MIDVTNLSNEHDGEAVADLRIRVSNGESEISVQTTFIDAWFDAIVEALHRLALSDDRIEIDLVDEPTPLIAFIDENNVVLEYGAQKVLLGPYDGARDEIIADITSILPEVERRSESAELLRRIRDGIAGLASSAQK